MAGPLDYSIDVQSPFQAALQGFQGGFAIREAQTKQAQQQAALDQQRQQQELLTNLARKPNASADDYAAAITQIPSLSEHLTRAWTMKNSAQQQSHASDLLKWGAAVKSGSPDVAVKQMMERADAMDAASGGQPTPESQAMRTNARALEANPQLGLGQIQALLAANPQGKQAADALSAFGSEQRAAEKAPTELAKAQADAKTAAVKAKYAESDAMMDLDKKGWDIRKIGADIDIAKQNSRIAAMNASISRESNDLKRQELGLKVQEARQKLDDKVREKVATAEAGASSIDNMLNTVERIKKNPSLNDVLGAIEGQLPALVSDESSDAIALIDTLGSQAFLAQIPNIKGMGALSNAEGEKLQSALTNLSRKQSEKQFRANLDEASRLLNKGRDSLSKSTGVPLGKPDTPAAPGARPPLSSFNR